MSDSVNQRKGKTTSLPDVAQLRRWCEPFGLHPVGVVSVDPAQPAAAAARAARRDALARWTAAGLHGQMHYMARDIDQRSDPARLVAGARSVIMVALSYTPANTDWVMRDWQQLQRSGAAYVSNYARGRDYHKLLRRRLQQLADRMGEAIGPFAYRAFADSAPVMEVALGGQAGLGWRGKHTLLLNRTQGSMFFLGSLVTDLPVDADAGVDADAVSGTASPVDHCGSCRRCIDVCPTQAITAPRQLDASRCISYLTIELKETIPADLRPLIGNRIYGCDDCQLVCPWNRFAQAGDPAFAPRHGLEKADLATLFAWTPSDFDARTQGSPIRRIGHERWLRNIAVALGNSADMGAGVAAGQRMAADSPVTVGEGAVDAMSIVEEGLPHVAAGHPVAGDVPSVQPLQSVAPVPSVQSLRSHALAALATRANHESALVREHVAWARERLA